MRIYLKPKLLLIGMAMIPGLCWSAPSKPQAYTLTSKNQDGVLSESLDQKKIHDIYSGGDFDVVIKVLEGFMAKNPSFSFTDSVFIAKHLAVVYCADPASREKGRYYIMRLLELLPSAKLIDMYVSEEVDRIFDKTKEEYFFHKKKDGSNSLNSPVVAQSPHPATEPKSNPPVLGFNRPRNWILGGSILAIGAATSLWYINSKSGNAAPSAPIKPRN